MSNLLLSIRQDVRYVVTSRSSLAVCHLFHSTCADNMAAVLNTGSSDNLAV